MICPNCGSLEDDGHKFCSSCGNKLATEETSEAIIANEPEDVTEEANAETGYVSEEANTDAGYVTEETGTEPEYTDVVTDSFYEDTFSEEYTENTNRFEQEVRVSSTGLGFAVAALICGILSIICCASSCFGVVLAIAGIIFAIIVLSKDYDGRGLAIAGLVTSIIGLLLSAALTVAVLESSLNTGDFQDTIENINEYVEDL